MPSAADQVASAVREAGGALRFDHFLDVALYGSAGFYAANGRAGRRGDFLTSPEVGPLFGAVLARWIDAQHAALGAPDDFLVVEDGAGPGTLARALLAAAPQWRDRYVAVEISASQRESHPDGVRSVPRFDEPVACGVVLANELLDNLPFRLAVFDGVWREAYVGLDRSGVLVEVTCPAPDDWTWLPAEAPHGGRVPVQQRAAEWVHSYTHRVAAGRILALDYCSANTADLARMPWREWLRTYVGHERGSHYLRDVGAQDVTAQVCLDQLPPSCAVHRQHEFLARWGIAELVDEGRRLWERSASAPTLDALRGRSRVREAEALLDPSGLGGFQAVEWSVGSASATGEVDRSS